MSRDDVSRILEYHTRTKHHPSRYARGPGQLDWATQPDPFRTYALAPQLELPLAADALDTPWTALSSPQAVPARPVGLESLAAFFELALGLSAWKEFRTSRWALRCDPSSGNLHPTEGYLLTAALPGVPAGLYHYVSRDHLLERRWTPEEPDALARLLPNGQFLVGLSAIHWRESWKYGERAFRYCQHDAGHCIATVRYAAAALGWPARLEEAPGDALRARLMGLDRDEDYAAVDAMEREHPDALIAVGGPGAVDVAALAALTARGTWAGIANVLSNGHVSWGAIDAAAEAALKPDGAPEAAPPATDLPPLAPVLDVPAATLIRQRRSAVQLDGKTSITAAQFFRVLDALLPRPGVAPWDAIPWAPHVHPAFMVHRVVGLEEGLYFLERAPGATERLRAACTEPFVFAPVPQAPAHLPLVRLASGEAKQAARVLSCHQEIAADGAFTLGMLAWFGESIRARGAWWWRRLFWEAGVLGQVLYLEAEATGVRGTGIGCYFDDVFHELFGFRDDRFQSLYHFTVGGPVEDTRIMTRPAYEHLATRARLR